MAPAAGGPAAGGKGKLADADRGDAFQAAARLRERQVIRRRSFMVRRQTPGEALADLDLLDYDFHLFTDRMTGQDSVLYRAADGYCLARAGARPPRTRRCPPR